MSIPLQSSPRSSDYGLSSETKSAEKSLLDDGDLWSHRIRLHRQRRKRHTWIYAAVCVVSTTLIVILGCSSILTLNHGIRQEVLQSSERQEKSGHSICSKPRKRKEWRTLTGEEQQEYIKAVQCFTKLPSITIPNATLHDEFAHTHYRQSEISHKSAPFLPWHRYFLHFYERMLQHKCHYSGMLPYWDWTQDWQDPLQAPIWNPVTGFGSNGNTATPQTVGFGHCVEDGPFAGMQVKYYGNSNLPHCLSRGFIPPRVRPHFGPQVVNSTAMAAIFDTDDFYEFTSNLEAGPHLAIPRLVQGDWREHTAPNDPVFYLHHAQLDRLWWKWQMQNPAKRAMAYNGPAYLNASTEANLTDELDLELMLTTEIAVPKVTVEKVMLPDRGFMCYDYAVSS